MASHHNTARRLISYCFKTCHIVDLKLSEEETERSSSWRRLTTWDPLTKPHHGCFNYTFTMCLASVALSRVRVYLLVGKVKAPAPSGDVWIASWSQTASVLPESLFSPSCLPKPDCRRVTVTRPHDSDQWAEITGTQRVWVAVDL